MSDERLRELERKWKESGSVEDEAAYLVERLRVGGLSQEALDLTVFMNHPASRIAVGNPILTAPRGRSPLEWGEMVVNAGKETVIRVMIAAIRQTIPVWKELPDNPFLDVPEQALSAVEKWLICRQISGEYCDAHSAEVGRFTAVVEPPVAMATGRSIDENIAARAQNVVLNVQELIECCLDTPEPQGLEWLIVHAGEAQHQDARWDETVANLVYQAIADELVPCLLGYRDPIRERVDARDQADEKTSD